MIYLVCYDISSPRRLGRVARHLEKKGLRVQYSFFQCDLTPDQLRELVRDLRERLNEEKDKLYVYPICEACARSPLELGTGKLLCLDSYEII